MTADGVTQTTLTKIPFSVSANGKVEVTALFSILIFNPANPKASGIGGNGLGANIGTLNCTLRLDGASVSSLSDAFNSYNVVSQDEGITKTFAIASGSHMLSLVCVALLNNPLYDRAVLEMRATGRGMSAIVLY